MHWVWVCACYTVTYKAVPLAGFLVAPVLAPNFERADLPQDATNLYPQNQWEAKQWAVD